MNWLPRRGPRTIRSAHMRGRPEPNFYIHLAAGGGFEPPISALTEQRCTTQLPSNQIDIDTL